MGILELILWTGSVIALGVVAWTLFDAALYQRRGLAHLEVSGDGLPGEASLAPADVVAGERVDLPEGTPLATIEIPRLGVEAVVAEGDSDLVLRRAVGHLPDTARPGEVGNVALAAHRDSYFRSLGEIRVGDEIVLANPALRDRYRVEWTEVVSPERVDVLAPTDEATLTLITCHPFWWIGPAPNRFVVRARRVEPEVEVPVRAGGAGGESACGVGPSSVAGC